MPEGAYTPNHHFYLPYAGEQGWRDKVNQIFSDLDTLLNDYKKSGYIKLVHLDPSILQLLQGAVQQGGAAGGDLTGTYPNPQLRDRGVPAGTYGFAEVTVNTQGLVTAIKAGNPNGHIPGPNTVGTVQLKDREVTTTKIGIGAITDELIGPRTATPRPATGFTGLLTDWLNWLTHAISSITGRPFGQAPVTNLEELNANVARKNLSETIGGLWNFQKPLAVGTPTADSHAATLAVVRSMVGGVDTSIPDGSIPASKLAEDARPYSVSTFYPGRPIASSLVLYWVADRAMVVRAQTPGQAIARKTAAADTVITLAVADQPVGTIRFAAGSRIGTIQLNNDFTVGIGQELSATAPATQDATLSDVTITIRGAYLP